MILNEAEFQEEVLGALRAQGAECTKFTDMFNVGLPDTWVGSKKFGAFAELKFVRRDNPKLTGRTVHAMMEHKVTGPQKVWLLRNWMKPTPTGVLVGTTTGDHRPGHDFQWIFIAAPKIEKVLGMCFEDIPWTVGKVTLPGLLESLRTSMTL